MRPITVDKGPLLATLRKNRDAHRAIFEEALEGYRKKAIEVFEDRLAQIKSGKGFQSYVSLAEPDDHTNDYDVAIAMIEMSVHDQIELDELSFRQFVRDEWQWKKQFLMTNSGYSRTAARMAGEDE